MTPTPTQGGQDVWKIRAEDFFLNERPEDQLRFLLRYAILAPSSHNTQPWLFDVRDSEFELWVDMSRALPHSDPTGREMYLSLGCCLGNFLLAAESFGVGPICNFRETNAEKEPVS